VFSILIGASRIAVVALLVYWIGHWCWALAHEVWKRSAGVQNQQQTYDKLKEGEGGMEGDDNEGEEEEEQGGEDSHSAADARGNQGEEDEDFDEEAPTRQPSQQQLGAHDGMHGLAAGEEAASQILSRLGAAEREVVALKEMVVASATPDVRARYGGISSSARQEWGRLSNVRAELFSRSSPPRSVDAAEVQPAAKSQSNALVKGALRVARLNHPALQVQVPRSSSLRPGDADRSEDARPSSGPMAEFFTTFSSLHGRLPARPLPTTSQRTSSLASSAPRRLQMTRPSSLGTCQPPRTPAPAPAPTAAGDRGGSAASSHASSPRLHHAAQPSPRQQQAWCREAQALQQVERERVRLEEPRASPRFDEAHEVDREKKVLEELLHRSPRFKATYRSLHVGNQ